MRCNGVENTCKEREDPDQDGGHLTDLTVWLPFIIVIVFLLFQWVKQIRLCKDALKA
ncbi:MAG: hypothetical protein Q4D51_09940 [Eubacteriales bacterium]|nr:hypothetical protein [Eubacteriales bacterium]